MVFRNLDGTKCYIANVFMEGENEIVTYRYWVKGRQKWRFETDFKRIFLLAFNYGWKWENPKQVKEKEVDNDDTFEFDTTALSKTDQIKFMLLLGSGVKVKHIKT